ncbi:hypothetical protein KR074_000476 [Drosophila pseudoananassae]|nr:hypothetical protein KR074_000476 [Drosophila pseudoananassae]
MRLSASFFVSIFALEILFVSVCRADDDDVAILEKGIKSLSNVMVTYQAEFDNKVKFVELQEAIDQIDISMRGYQGTAKNRLGLVRDLNSAARIEYHRCMGPVFEWCMSINRIFDIFIPYINDSKISKEDKDVIWSLTVNALESGLNKTAKSLDLLTSVQYKTAELKNLFKAIFHDVHNDFGSDGFYGKEMADMEDGLSEYQVARKAGVAAFVGSLFEEIGVLIFGPIGAALSFADAFAATYGIQELAHWQQKKTYKERIAAIDDFFMVLIQKIEEATEIVKDIESALEKDKTNLHKLRGVIEGDTNTKTKLLMNATFRRAQFVPDIQILQKQCTKYVEWHGYNDPNYKKIKSRARRAASSFSEGHRS